MLRKNKIPLIILLLCFTVMIIIQHNTPRPLNWRPTYSKKHKIPYGTYALNELLPDIFPGKKIETVNRPAYNILTEEFHEDKNYVFLSYRFNPDSLDVYYLMDYVARGNNAFIAANYFGPSFTDTFNFETQYYYGSFSMKNDSAAQVTIKTFFRDTVALGFANNNLKNPEWYIYPKGIDDFYFSSFDTANTVVLGLNGANEPNFIRVKHGDGNFFLSTVPQAFGNYCFTDETNAEYAYKALSYLPEKDVLWDEYYKEGNNKGESPLRFVFNNPPLLAAYYTIIGGLVLFMFFGSKRTQRVIPVMEPLKNTTLEFVDIVGSLYFQKGDHKNIAEKKINYFLDVIRSKFHVKTNLFDDEFIQRIVSLSGVSEEKVREVFRLVSYINARPLVSQEELLRLNSVIEDFYKHSKR